jgi:hypothetical protein
MPVEDRRISLDTRCNETASFSARMLGTTGGRSRTGAAAKDFLLCENHSQLVAQVDRELKEEGWGSAIPAKPTPLA